jgi:hypothetical protein
MKMYESLNKRFPRNDNSTAFLALLFLGIVAAWSGSESRGFLWFGGILSLVAAGWILVSHHMCEATRAGYEAGWKDSQNTESRKK